MKDSYHLEICKSLVIKIRNVKGNDDGKFACFCICYILIAIFFSIDSEIFRLASDSQSTRIMVNDAYH